MYYAGNTDLQKGIAMSDMIRVSSAEFQKTFGLLADKAITAPIAITKHGRDHLVVLSAGEYARLKRRDRRVHLAAELPDDLLAEVERARMDPRHDHLNALLDDDA